ncbi:MAG: anti-sigma factor family protein, partial [Acidimicrobiales bacterium]
MNADSSPTAPGSHLDHETLSAHVDGELDAAADRGVVGHLARCRECSARLDGVRRAIAAIGAPVPALAGSRREEILALAAGSAATGSAAGPLQGAPRSWWVGLSAAAAVLVLAVASLFAVGRGSGHRAPVVALEGPTRTSPSAGPVNGLNGAPAGGAGAAGAQSAAAPPAPATGGSAGGGLPGAPGPTSGGAAGSASPASGGGAVAAGPSAPAAAAAAPA